jgi:isochorismate synthase
MEDLLSKITDHYQKSQPFVAYASPESNTITALLQKDAKVYKSSDFTEEGFVFAPFSEGATLLIPKAKSEILKGTLSEKITPVTISSEENDSEKQIYKKLVSKAVAIISNGKAQKIVTSRCKEIKLKTFEFSEVVSRLFALYPGAFRYVWHHPESGTWCGATPEILIETQGKNFNSVALAATRMYVGNARASWTPKELNEQQWVVDAITARLKPLVSILKVSKTKDQRAGSLVHLRTDFQGILDKAKGGLG